MGNDSTDSNLKLSKTRKPYLFPRFWGFGGISQDLIADGEFSK